MTQPITRQAWFFLLSGVAASGSHYGIYLALVHFTGSPATAATAVGFCFGTIVSYFLNSRYTFTAAHRPGTFARFVAVTLAGGALNIGLVGLFTAFVHYAVAGLGAIVCAAAFNFAAHRAWTFREVQ